LFLCFYKVIEFYWITFRFRERIQGCCIVRRAMIISHAWRTAAGSLVIFLSGKFSGARIAGSSRANFVFGHRGPLVCF